MSETTLQDARTEDCVASAFRRWIFPAPDGGGTVIVNRPMRLRRVAGERLDNRVAGPMGSPPPFSELVLTRLHRRYTPEGLTEDLVFEPAAPIVGAASRAMRSAGSRAARAPG